MPNPGTPAYGLPPAEDDAQRRQADLKRAQREQAAARSLESATIGSGGLTVVDGFIDMQGGSNLHVGGDAVFDGTLTLPAGSLDTPGGSITAGVDVVAGRDLVAGRNAGVVQDITAGRDIGATRDLTAGRNVAATGDVTATGNVNATGVVVSPGSRAYVVSTSYAGAWLNGDGTLGISPSSRRFKTAIESWNPDPARILELRAVLYRYTFAEPDSPLQAGLIAEEVLEAGFPEFVFFDEAGKVEGVYYDKIAVALLVLAQRQEARLKAIETHLGL